MRRWVVAVVLLVCVTAGPSAYPRYGGDLVSPQDSPPHRLDEDDFFREGDTQPHSDPQPPPPRAEWRIIPCSNSTGQNATAQCNVTLVMGPRGTSEILNFSVVQSPQEAGWRLMPCAEILGQNNTGMCNISVIPNMPAPNATTEIRDQALVAHKQEAPRMEPIPQHLSIIPQQVQGQFQQQMVQQIPQINPNVPFPQPYQMGSQEALRQPQMAIIPQQLAPEGLIPTVPQDVQYGDNNRNPLLNIKPPTMPLYPPNLAFNPPYDPHAPHDPTHLAQAGAAAGMQTELGGGSSDSSKSSGDSSGDSSGSSGQSSGTSSESSNSSSSSSDSSGSSSDSSGSFGDSSNSSSGSSDSSPCSSSSQSSRGSSDQGDPSFSSSSVSSGAIISVTLAGSV